MDTTNLIADFCNYIEYNTSISMSKETTDEEYKDEGYLIYRYKSESNILRFIDAGNSTLFNNVLFILPQGDNKDYHKLEIIDEYFKCESSHIFIIDTKDFKNKMVIDDLSNISVITPNDLFDILINLSEYFNKLDNEKEFENIETDYVNRRVEFLNDPDKLSKCNAKCFNDTLINCWLTKTEINFPVLVLGDRGIGKTWSLRYFLNKQNLNHLNLEVVKETERKNSERTKKKNDAKDYKWKHPPVIYVNLGEISKSSIKLNSIEANIINHISELYDISFLGNGFNWSIWDALLKLGHIVLVLDGFDEISKRLNNEILSYYLNDIISYTKDYKRVIIASRINQFNSYKEIEKYFTQESVIKPLFYKNFNILKLKEFDTNEIKELTSKYKNDVEENHFIELLEMNKKTNNETITREIKSLSSNPAFLSSFIVLIQSDLPLIKVFAESINKAFIEFNMQKSKALKYIKEIVDGIPTRVPLRTTKKINYVRDIAWFLFEHNYIGLTKQRFTDFIQQSDKEIVDVDAFYNDIKCQTVFTSISQDVEMYSFLTEGLYCFFIGKYISDLLKSERELDFQKGLRILGLYNFNSNNNKFGKEILDFISEFIKESNEEFNKKLRNIDFKQVKYRFLFFNIKFINGYNDQQEDHWNKLNTYLAKQYTVLNEKFVLIIPNNNINLNTNKDENIPPLFIKRTEVTNEEFLDFLENGKSNLGNNLWKRNNLKVKKNLFSEIINEYHLLFWKNGIIPDELRGHPVVYISWFAAASYCNWLSYKDGIDPYYKFKNDNNNTRFKEIQRNYNSGYRLPNISEWEYVAREGNYNIKYPWDKFLISKVLQSEKNEITSEGIKLRHKLLDNKVNSIPVMSDNPDIFGTYGTMGNVREWVDKIRDNKTISVNEKMPIKGATWILGEDRFKYEEQGDVYAENTNFDVGFRVSRSLSTDEINILKKSNIL